MWNAIAEVRQEEITENWCYSQEKHRWMNYQGPRLITKNIKRFHRTTSGESALQLICYQSLTERRFSIPSAETKSKKYRITFWYRSVTMIYTIKPFICVWINKYNSLIYIRDIALGSVILIWCMHVFLCHGLFIDLKVVVIPTVSEENCQDLQGTPPYNFQTIYQNRRSSLQP